LQDAEYFILRDLYLTCCAIHSAEPRRVLSGRRGRWLAGPGAVVYKLMDALLGSLGNL